MLCKNNKDLPGEKSVDKILFTPSPNTWLGIIIITRAEDKTIKRAVIMMMSE